MRARVAAALAVVPLLLSACGGGSVAPGAEHVMADGSTMSGSSMAGMSKPSEAASMICSSEIRDAVRRVFQLSEAPTGRPSWSHQVFGCTYPVAHGELRMSVKDLDVAGPGRAYFDDLRTSLAGASAIKGVAAFGFPAFETPQGDVVFLKDHKTLRVDATRVAAADLPQGTNRQDAAYGVAAAVIACWTE
ncbi:hypothetical protein [Nocardioides cynanchi]|uniref:hypothetical protein n=1 Tax=Nocardioides cynanchi TaxID=2558918 RepID=UPI00124444C5|nr:hypothetical protein [Nocardioides cynanchi]